MPHDHHGHHHHSHTDNKKVLAVSFALISFFMVVEAAGGFTNSLALLSDAGHMFGDAFSLGIALLAFKIGENAATPEKTFGYKRFEILTAAFNGMTLMAIAALIFYEAIGRFIRPPEVATTGMLLISIIGLLVNLFVAWYMLRGGDTESNINMRGAYLHVSGDLLGLLGAVTAAVLMMAFGWKWADPLVSVLVAGLVGRSGWQVFRKTLHILMEGTPEDVDVDALLAAIRQTEGVKSVHDLHMWTITSNINALSCHIVVDGALSVIEAEQIVYRIEHTLLHHNIRHTTIQVESSGHPHDDKLLCSVSESGHTAHGHYHAH